ncbi:MAG: hypothetical protein AAF518_02975 [Spirochaetota bacterium]
MCNPSLLTEYLIPSVRKFIQKPFLWPIAILFFPSIACSKPYFQPQVATQSFSYLFIDKNLQNIYRETPQGIYMYKEPVVKNDSAKAEFFVAPEEIPIFRNMFSYLQEEEILKVYLTKSDKKIEEILPLGPSYKVVPKLPKVSQATKPLEHLRIAIDPGHIAGTWKESVLEDRYVSIRVGRGKKSKKIRFYESELAYDTARILRDYLKRDGATVFITKKAKGITAFGLSFAEWKKKRKLQALESEFAKGNITAAEKEHLANKAKDRELFHKFFRTFELNERSRLINAFHPHATVVIHYNIEPDHIFLRTRGSSIGISKNNYSMSFVPGGFEEGSMQEPENRLNLLRLLLTDDLQDSLEFCSFVQKSFETILKVPHIPSHGKPGYLRDTSVETTVPGVYSRNLRLTRKVYGPICYGESLYQNNVQEYQDLSRKDYRYRGKKIPKRIQQNAYAYYQGIRKYFQKKRKIHSSDKKKN